MNTDKPLMRPSSAQSISDSTVGRRTLFFGSPQILGRDMSKMVNRKLFSDVHFIVGPEREKIWGHKCILSARSSMFRHLFFTEPDKASFDLCSVKQLPFIILLYFLYTNSISFDRLNIYEVFDVMRIAEEYKCSELAKITEVQIGVMFDPKTVFEFLPNAFQLNREYMKASALEYIEDYSSILLVANNEDLLILTPRAMKAILDSDQLDIDELRVVEVACYWAENYILHAREYCLNVERGNARASIIKFQPSADDSTQGSSESSTGYPFQEEDKPLVHSAILQEAYDNVADVMSSLRLALIPPADLVRLEEEQLAKKIIPQKCFIDAWRIQALQYSHSTENKLESKNLVVPRKGTLTRAQRRKSFADPNLQMKRSKSIGGRAAETGTL